MPEPAEPEPETTQAPLSAETAQAPPPSPPPDGPAPDPLDLSELTEMTIQVLTARAEEMGILGAAGTKKADLIFRILQHQAERNGLLFAEGVLESIFGGLAGMFGG